MSWWRVDIAVTHEGSFDILANSAEQARLEIERKVFPGIGEQVHIEVMDVAALADDGRLATETTVEELR